MKLDNVINKIQNLLKKTVESGATENEAISAMEMAQKLMDKYDIAMSQVEENKQKVEFGVAEVHTGVSRSNKIRERVVVGIGIFTDTRVWVHGGSNVKYCFFGTQESTAFATTLYGMLINAIEHELKLYKVTDAYKNSNQHATVRCRAFREAMAGRLQQRMITIKNESNKEKEAQAQETGIVLYNKKGMVEKAYEDQGFQHKKGRKKKASKTDDDAAQAGRKAAEKYEFNKTIRGKNEKTGHGFTRKFLK